MPAKVETLRITVDGRKQDVPANEVPEKNLRWYADECRNPKLQGIAQRELKRRGKDPGGKSKGDGASIAKRSPGQSALTRAERSELAIEGCFRDARQATQALRDAADRFHLVSPAPMVGTMPEGCALSLSVVRISPDDPHLYEVGGKLALDKTHLAALGNASGASTVYSRRTDDGSHPHYCAWTVQVRFRQFDGTWLFRQGSVEMDLREPYGAEYVDCVRKAEKKGRDPEGQLGELRRFITRHAESKALNRAYSAIGIRRAYTRAELDKPFCVARILFTGQSDDPEARALFRAGIMQSFLGSANDAYGPGEPAPRPAEQLAAPPPMQAPDYSEPATYDVDGEEYGTDDELSPQESTPLEPARAGADTTAGASASPPPATEGSAPDPEDF